MPLTSVSQKIFWKEYTNTDTIFVASRMHETPSQNTAGRRTIASTSDVTRVIETEGSRTKRQFLESWHIQKTPENLNLNWDTAEHVCTQSLERMEKTTMQQEWQEERRWRGGQPPRKVALCLALLISFHSSANAILPFEQSLSSVGVFLLRT